MKDWFARKHNQMGGGVVSVCVCVFACKGIVCLCKGVSAQYERKSRAEQRTILISSKRNQNSRVDHQRKKLA